MNLSITIVISVMLCLLGCLGWYYGSAPSHYLMNERSLSLTPDLTLFNVKLYEFGDTGQLAKQMNTDVLTHIPKDDAYQLHAPDIHFHDQDNQLWHLVSNEANTKQGFDIMVFQGNVLMQRIETSQTKPFDLQTESLTYLTKKEQAFTNEAVAFKQVGNTIHAHGMQADLKTNHILLREAKAIMQPENHA